MTTQERTAIFQQLAEAGHAPDTTWRDLGGNLVALKAKPCPFFVFSGCLVYASRPYNCRRFGCMRPDPKTEAYVEAQVPAHTVLADIVCVNLRVRLLQSRVARRAAILLQRKAQRWADTHGWLEVAATAITRYAGVSSEIPE